MSRITQRRSLAALVVAGLAATATVLAAAPAGAVAVVQLTNGVGVTPGAGWRVGTKNADNVTLTHKSPKAVFAVLAAGTVAATALQADQANLTQFAKGFGLKSVKQQKPQQASESGPTFNQVAVIKFTAKQGRTSLVGEAAEYQNSETNNGAFAIVLAPTTAQNALQKSVAAMFESIISDT